MKAKFTGHDTFPLRYGWLYKAVNHLNNKGKLQTSNEQSTRDAIVELGVGKNMVNAIRYWAEATSIIDVTNKANVIEHTVSETGQYLFEGLGGNERDPYLEKVGSIWLVHFWLNFDSKLLTSYRYFFNFSNIQHFEKSKLTSDCIETAKKLVSNDIGNESTIKKDIDCFLNTYCKKFKSASVKKKSGVDEDHFTSPLAELNLIQDNGGGFYVSDLTERPELPIDIFIYCLIKFAQIETAESKINNVDFESLLTKPYSPGRIFRLSESGLGQKLDEAQEYTAGDISWIDSLGLRQVKIDLNTLNSPIAFLDKYYGNN
ncbi:DUF4007 family protein [Shewanella sp. 10N.7]|uniref:DUF4007 family protein n=1 Tax=Shewanella sp. 10N.7 TaxID=2885093 RepID=UPI001E44C147|nr:DUF4007 family protein [Shewanella sp. 10N.7]MCC4832820.1 DUF4007 family protein [Shewanella sp. 10N.7]